MNYSFFYIPSSVISAMYKLPYFYLSKFIRYIISVYLLIFLPLCLYIRQSFIGGTPLSSCVVAMWFGEQTMSESLRVHSDWSKSISDCIPQGLVRDVLVTFLVHSKSQDFWLVIKREMLLALSVVFAQAPLLFLPSLCPHHPNPPNPPTHHSSKHC